MIAYKIPVGFFAFKIGALRSKSPQGTSQKSAYRPRSYHEKRGENTERKIMQWLAFVRGSQVGLVKSQDLPLCRVSETFRLEASILEHQSL